MDAGSSDHKSEKTDQGPILKELLQFDAEERDGADGLDRYEGLRVRDISQYPTIPTNQYKKIRDMI